MLLIAFYTGIVQDLKRKSHSLFADLVFLPPSLSFRSSSGLASFFPLRARVERDSLSPAGDSGSSSSSSLTLSAAADCSRTDLETTSSLIPLPRPMRSDLGEASRVGG
jgi:hypothetical protein